MKSKSIKRKLSFVLYEDNVPPRYYEMSKQLLRFLLYGLPTITLVSLLIVASGGVYFKQIQKLAQRKEPAIIKLLKSEKAELLKKEQELSLDNTALQKKLAQGVSSKSGLGFLALFKQSAGRQDLSSSPEMAIQEVEVIKRESQIELSFKIFNMTKDQSKLTGYLFVIMQNGDRLQVWPANTFDNQSMQVPFSKGEFFATSRFRPVQATFDKLQSPTGSLFKVVVFGRTGDLIFKQLISRPL